MTTLKFKGKFGYKVPLGEINFEMETGDFVGIRGANGSGKSTLLKTLSGYVAPISGMPLLGTVPVSEKAVVRKIRSIDAPSFLPDLTVREHLELVCSSKEIQETQTSKWRLEEILDFPPSWLSSGQKQRAFLALHILENVDFLLLDEPERHLDSDWVDNLADELKSTANEGVGVLVVSHDKKILDSCDRGIEL